MQEQQPTDYDAVPYRSYPFRDTHPRQLQSQAWLFGHVTAPPEAASVLELGCASGGNLIPLAAEFPNGRFVGIDLSQRQVADGNQLIGRLQLANIELRHVDLSDVGADWGKFDYIICHGVYSWVTRDVQQCILRICHDNLAADGVAVVSYNALPGWYARCAVRDMVCHHTESSCEPGEKIREANGLLGFVLSAAEKDSPYREYLKQEAATLAAADNDTYFLHEHLAEHNEPIYFREFARRAADAGLQYLSEARFAASQDHALPDRARATLRQLPFEKRQQYLDYVRNTEFRMSVVCHAAVSLDRNVTGRRLRPGWFSVERGRLQHDERFVPARRPMEFTHGRRTLVTACPMVQAALVHLSESAPAAISFDELAGAAAQHVSKNAAATNDVSEKTADWLSRGLLEALSADVIDFYLDPPQPPAPVSVRPVAAPLARLQAEQDGRVAGPRHRVLRFGALGRFVVCRLDGRHDRDDLVRQLQTEIDRGVMRLKDGRCRDREELARMVDETLAEVANAGLLVE